MSKVLIGLIVILVLGGGVYYYLQSLEEGTIEQAQGSVTDEVMEEKDQETEDAMIKDEDKGEGDAMEEGEGIIEESGKRVIAYTDSGFLPKALTIKQGETVTFQNESGRNMWPATAVHPSHTVYPGSGIGKCKTPEESQIFDACKGRAPGEEFSFTFNESGSWQYHDHLRVSNWGTIIVE